MQLKKLKVGSWYKTKAGVGKCLDTGGRFPPAAKFEITAPFPRGVCYVVPRDIEEEVPAPEEGKKPC